MRAIRSWWLIMAFVSGFGLAMVAEELVLHWNDNHLEFAAPHVHFLKGRPLEMLHNAEAVPFDFQVTLWSNNRNHVFQKTTDRFVISYSLWEEKYMVVKTQSPVRKIEHLTAPEAEKWCLRQMSIDPGGLDGSAPLWARLEIRAEDAKTGPLFGRGSVGESGISLTSLIEIFSRPAQSQQSHWGPFDSGPFTINELKRNHARGS